MGRLAFWVALLVIAVLPPPLRAADAPLKNSDCLDCHGDRTLNKTNSAGRVISLFVDEARLKASIHQTNTCVSCHADLTAKHPDDNVAPKPVDCAKCHARQSDSYGASVHGIASHNRNLAAATCSDCHPTRPTPR